MLSTAALAALARAQLGAFSSSHAASLASVQIDSLTAAQQAMLFD